MNCVSCLTHIAEYVIINISGQGLPAELGKHIWLAKTNTSQEAPNSISGSSSRKHLSFCIRGFITYFLCILFDIINNICYNINKLKKGVR